MLISIYSSNLNIIISWILLDYELLKLLVFADDFLRLSGNFICVTNIIGYIFGKLKNCQILLIFY